VNFTYNGEDQFKTILGATASIIIMAILAAFAISKFNELVNRLNPNVIKSTFLRNLTLSEPYRPQDLGFDFAFGLDQNIDPTYGYFTAKSIDLSLTDKLDPKTGVNIKNKTTKSLEFGECSDSYFNFPN
jgi:hypothetical protein